MRIRRLALAGLVALALPALPVPASAATVTYAGFPPFSHQLEGAVGLGDTPFGLSASATVWVTAGAWANVAASYGFMRTEDQQAGLLLGLNQTWVAPVPSPTWEGLVHGAIGGTVGLEPVKILFGAYWERSWDRFRVRVAPTLSTYAPWSGSFRTPPFNWTEAGLIGPPWLEVGYRVAPNLDLALRSNLTPLALTWRF